MIGVRFRIILLATCLVTLSACAVEATYRGHLDVWNRTTTPVRVVGSDATLVVPGCAHVSSDRFVLNRYDIVDSEGHFIARHGGGGSDPANVTPMFEMVTSSGAVYSDSHPPPAPLPTCAGTIAGQP